MVLTLSASAETLRDVIKDYRNPDSYGDLCTYVELILSAAYDEYQRKPIREQGDDNPFIGLEQLLGLIIYEWPSVDNDDAYNEYLVALYQLLYEEAGKYYYPVTDVQTELPDELMPPAHWDLTAHRDYALAEYQRALFHLIATRASV